MGDAKQQRGPYRPYPFHTLAEALVVAQKIRDEKAGKPMNRLLLADALGVKPASSNYRDLLSSSVKYGLTEGTEKAKEIKLTDGGEHAVSTDSALRQRALRRAAMTPKVFRRFYEAYADGRLPTILSKVLTTDFGVPAEHADECGSMLVENGRMTGLIRDISGSPHVMLDGEIVIDDRDDPGEGAEAHDPDTEVLLVDDEEHTVLDLVSEEANTTDSRTPKPIFLGHGKNRVPLEKLEKQLATFQIPAKVVVQEPHLGRPIPTKVKQTMMECGSAILIFTKDERFFDADGTELWRPSENVVYELGAASYVFEDRVVILKEAGVSFPANFSSIGYIEFEVDNIEAKWMDVLKELIGFGLVRLTTG